jgi:hypothetical protein
MNAPALASFDHEGLALSLLVPLDWDAEELAPHQVRFFGPVQPDLDDYRPTMSFTVGEPEGFGDAWFDAFCGEALERLRSSYEGFELIDTERSTLSSLAPLHAIWYRWQPEPELRFTQVQALVAVDATRMYLVNGATLVQREDEFVPTFRAVLQSMRILSRR